MVIVELKVNDVPIDQLVLALNVPIKPLKLADKQVAPTVVVTVPLPEPASKNTSSAAVGTVVGIGTPEANDQLAAVLQLFPLPPIQYLLGITQ
jgi:hypothetical protein